MSDTVELQIIGKVKSCYPDKFGTPRQPGLAADSRAFLQLHAALQPEQSLSGLEQFSHIWVVFLFHKNNQARFHAKVHPPRLGGDTIGLFATRSPHRPNPIGLSLLEIEKVESDGIWVKGIDLIDGTPILDIKPYLKDIESKPEASEGWISRLESSEIAIEWTDETRATIDEYESRGKKVRQLIEQTLALDPRPVAYRGFEGVESPYRECHAVRIYDLDIHFRFLARNRLRIENVII